MPFVTNQRLLRLSCAVVVDIVVVTFCIYVLAVRP